jgi:glycosyltransferase involved in cell wall biosynthesis
MERNKIRIIITILVPHSYSHDGNTGGLVRMVEILKRITSLGEISIVLVSSDKSYKDYFRENNINVDFKLVKSNLKFKSSLGLGLKSLYIIIKTFFVLKTDFLESKDEKIVAYSSSDLFWEVIPAFVYKLKNNKIKWIQVIHHIYPDWRKRPGSKFTNIFGYYLQRFSLKLIKKNADTVIVVNSLVRDELIGLGLNPDKIQVLSNGIDHEYFDDIKKDDFSFEGCFLGRLDHSKGVFDLIAIWDKVCQKMPTAKLVLIGGSFRMREKLEKIARERKLQNNIKFLGFLKNDKAFPIVKSSKVFLSPSHEEGWGISIAEAMACGLPVIAWNLPVYQKVFENHLIEIKENNIEKFSNQVIKLLFDSDKRKETGEANKKFIQKYSWKSVSQNEFEVIKDS